MKPPGPHVHYLSLQQAAILAGLDRATIKRLVTTGQLPSVIIPGDAGKWRRVPRSEVLALRRAMDAAVGA